MEWVKPYSAGDRVLIRILDGAAGRVTNDEWVPGRVTGVRPHVVRVKPDDGSPIRNVGHPTGIKMANGRRRNPTWKLRVRGRYRLYRLVGRGHTFSLADGWDGLELACWKGGDSAKARMLPGSATRIIDRQSSDESYADALDRLKLKAERMLAVGKCQGWT
jgi:hypothetical protein